MYENSGYVYALINPSLEGQVRIEVTKGDPFDGAKDLSIASNNTASYIVIFEQWFKDCVAAAEFVQHRLAKYRSAETEGFFRISNTDVVLTILEAKKALDEPEKPARADSLVDTAKRNRRKFCNQLLVEGRRFQYGDSSTAKDEEEAIKVFMKAIDMNCLDANRLLGTLYFERFTFQTSSVLDLQMALKFYEADISKGNSRCWGDAARCYESLQQYRKAEIYWVNFWEGMKENIADLDKKSQNLYSTSFQKYMISPARLDHRELTLNIATKVGAVFSELPEGKNEKQYETLFGEDYPAG